VAKLGILNILRLMIEKAMKVAIIGSGPLAIEIAIYMDSLNSTVTLFGKNTPGGKIKQMLKYFPEHKMESVLTPWGKKLLNETNEVSNLSEYWTNYLYPLIQSPVIQRLFCQGEVIRVQKRFLASDEFSSNRMQDDFRVVYLTYPKSLIEKQVQDTPETFEKMDKKIIESLKTPLENYQDFDVVIDASGVLDSPIYMGPGGNQAIHEGQFSKHIYYGIEGFEGISSLKGGEENILIVGSGMTSALFLLKLAPHIFEHNKRVFIITQEQQPFEKLLANKNFAYKKELLDILQRSQNDYEKDRKKCLDKLQKWKSLEDYERVKMPRPKEPIEKIHLFKGTNVISIDRFADQKSFYITLERPSFRGEELLKTISVDTIFVSTGYRIQNQLFQNIKANYSDTKKFSQDKRGFHPEPGFYTLGPVKNERYGISDGIEQIPKIAKKILSYFQWTGK
jgi:thioredoxin reductase